MMFHVMRSWYKYGREGDEVIITDKYYDTIEKALAYAQRYATGIRFVMVQIETDDDNMELIYEYLADGGRCTIDKTAKYKIAAEDKEEPAEEVKIFNTLSEMKKDTEINIMGFCKTENKNYISYQTKGKILSMSRTKFLKFLLENEEYIIKKFNIDRHTIYEMTRNCHDKAIKDENGKIVQYRFIAQF